MGEVLRALVDDVGDTAVSQQVARALVADGGAGGLLGEHGHQWHGCPVVLEEMSDAWLVNPDAGEEALGYLVRDGDA